MKQIASMRYALCACCLVEQQLRCKLQWDASRVTACAVLMPPIRPLFAVAFVLQRYTVGTQVSYDVSSSKFVRLYGVDSQ